MRDGHIEQAGSPEEVFHRPATRFVAGFIGSPTMNLIEAEMGDGRLTFANGDWLPAPERFRNASLQGKRVTFGIRPDDVYPTGHGLASAGASQIVERELAVSVTEPLGNETLVFVGFGGADVITRMLHPSPLDAGARIPVSFDLARAHLFAAEGGLAIAPSGGL